MSIARKVKGRENVTDITQNVFSHLWEYRRSLLGVNTENIIFNTCKQEIAKFIKAEQKRLSDTVPLLLEEPDDSYQQLLSKLTKENQLEAITKNIESLPPLRKKIFTLNKLQGITQEEIAHQLQIPHHKVKHHISQVMIFLKKQA